MWSAEPGMYAVHACVLPCRFVLLYIGSSCPQGTYDKIIMTLSHMTKSQDTFGLAKHWHLQVELKLVLQKA